MSISSFDIAIMGCGNMGAALISGYLREHGKSRILIVDPDIVRAKGLVTEGEGLSFSPTLAPLRDETAALTIIAVKPQSCVALLDELVETTAAKGLVLSIAAGVTSRTLKRGLPQARVVRSMPNTPAMAGAGTTAIWCEQEVSNDERRICQALFEAVGTVEWVDDEGLIDAATAISGSGPAYVFAFVEALARAGESIGLEPALAARLARGTFIGAAAMLADGDKLPGHLKAAVRSPAGTTDAALRVFEAGDSLLVLMLCAVEAAFARSGQLSRSVDDTTRR